MPAPVQGPSVMLPARDPRLRADDGGAVVFAHEQGEAVIKNDLVGQRAR